MVAPFHFFVIAPARRALSPAPPLTEEGTEALTEIVTEVPVTETPTEAVPTEALTEAATEALTEAAPTEALTEAAPTEALTEAATEALTEAAPTEDGVPNLLQTVLDELAEPGALQLEGDQAPGNINLSGDEA